MTAHATIYDYMAERFRFLKVDSYPLERLIMDAEQEGFTELWEMPRSGVVNAMKLRGLIVSNGLVSRPKDADDNYIDPVASDYQEFTAAAKQIIDEAEYPIDTAELAEMTGLATVAIPYSTMSVYLRRVGVHYIPGCGYWRHPQYMTPKGQIISKRCRSERVDALNHYFETHGYPVVGREAEAATDGLVTSRFLTRYATESRTPAIVPIGSGLYVPVDAVDKKPLPMSPNVASHLLSLEPNSTINDKKHLRLFRLGLVLERGGYAEISMSRSTVDGERCQTMRLAITEEGRKILERRTRPGTDEF